MNNHVPRYLNQHDVAAQRRRRRRKRKQQNIWPILTLGIVLAVMIGFAVRVGVFGQWVSAIPGTSSDFSPSGSKPADENGAQSFTLPDSVTVHPLYSALGEHRNPSDFVSGLDNSGLTVQYTSPPDFQLQGKQTVQLTFSNGNDRTYVDTELHLFNLIKEVRTAINSSNAIDIRSFVPDATIDAYFVGLSPEQIPEHTSGIFDLIINCNGTEYPVRYLIAENTPPTGTGQRITAAAGILPPAETLVTNIQDDSNVTVSYLTKPDMTVLGLQDVVMVLTDVFGNTSHIPASIEIIPAEDGPRFSGLEELHIQVGSTISYKAGVTATDPEDGELTFTVDPGNVDAKNVGTYTAAYSAKDSSGNCITAYRTIVVQDEAAAAVEEYARNVLKKIITDDMTLDQKIYKVYLYTKSNVQFIGTSDKSSVVHGAYEGFSTGKGDCYTYYAMNVVLLDLLGIKNIEVKRINGSSNHWWNLVLHEDGIYYHVDSCPKSIYLDGISYYRMSDTDLDTYTYNDAVFAHRPNYYLYDKTLPEYQDITIAP